MWVDESLLTDPVTNVMMVIGWWERDKRNPRKAVNTHQILFDLTAKCLPPLLQLSSTPRSAMTLPRLSPGHVWGLPSWPLLVSMCVLIQLGTRFGERGKNLNAVTKGETYSDLWMDDLIYATAVNTSNHLRANGNLDGYIMLVVILVFSADPLHWGQRGSYLAGTLWVFWEFLNNLHTLYPVGKCWVLTKLTRHFDHNVLCG